jgi:hypothetical protein
MIDPHFWESGDVKKLDFFARLLLIGMFSLADDEGRGTGGASYLKSIVFPHDEISKPKMAKALKTIKGTISVTYYDKDGQEYYQFDNWKKWQRVDKPKKSLLPPPPFHSGIDSKNDSGMILDNGKSDSLLKEKKEKEEKSREAEASAREECADLDDPIPDLPPEMRNEKVAGLSQQLTDFLGAAWTSMQMDTAEFLIEQHGKPWFDQALRESSDAGAKNLAYVRAKLEAWAAKGGPDADKRAKRRDAPEPPRYKPL